MIVYLQVEDYTTTTILIPTAARKESERRYKPSFGSRYVFFWIFFPLLFDYLQYTMSHHQHHHHDASKRDHDHHQA